MEDSVSNVSQIVFNFSMREHSESKHGTLCMYELLHCDRSASHEQKVTRYLIRFFNISYSEGLVTWKTMTVTWDQRNFLTGPHSAYWCHSPLPIPPEFLSVDSVENICFEMLQVKSWKSVAPLAFCISIPWNKYHAAGQPDKIHSCS